jgi:hypothetical protein
MNSLAAASMAMLSQAYQNLILWRLQNIGNPDDRRL